jgi:hypothetical protein
MKNKALLELLAPAFLSALVEVHGREHAADILRRIADGIEAGLPIDCDCAAQQFTPYVRQH